MIWTTDERGSVTFVNARLAGLHGHHARGGARARPGRSACTPTTPTRWFGSWLRALAKREPWEREYRLRASDGEYRWIVERGVPRFEEGGFVGYVGTATDVHERKLMEGALRSVYEREHTIAETLQRSLLPERLPESTASSSPPATCRPAAAPRSAATGTTRSSCRTAAWRWWSATSSATACAAAAVMGQLRNACRAYACSRARPAEVIAPRQPVGRDRRGRADGHGALPRARPRDGRASAAPAPATRRRSCWRPTASPRFLEGGRSVAARRGRPRRSARRRRPCRPGATLLLYTDGLVERRDVPLDDRLGALRAAGAAPEASLEAICDAVLAGVLGAEASRRTTSRYSPCAAAARAEPLGAARCRPSPSRCRACAAGSAASCTRPEPTTPRLRDHAHDLRGGRQRDRARLRPRRRRVRRRGRLRTTSCRHRQRPRPLARAPGAHRGRGLNIIEGLMDDVQVSTEGDGTVVRMKRRLGHHRAA